MGILGVYPGGQVRADAYPPRWRGLLQREYRKNEDSQNLTCHGTATPGAFFFSRSMAFSLTCLGWRRTQVLPAGQASTLSCGVGAGVPAGSDDATGGGGGLCGNAGSAASTWEMPVVRSTLRRSPFTTSGLSGSLVKRVTITPPPSSALLALTSKSPQSAVALCLSLADSKITLRLASRRTISPFS